MQPASGTPEGETGPTDCPCRRVSPVMNRLALLLIALASLGATKQELKIQEDRELAEDHGWIYNDMAKGFAQATKTGKPLLVVLRCPT